MIDPESLSPVEVLAHLKQLGYKNISTPQLKEFMHDLKKLIRYEQKCRHGFGSVFERNSSNGTIIPSSPMQTNGNECDSDDDCSSTDSGELCTNCNVTETDSVCDGISNISSSANSNYRKRKIQFNQTMARPHSSFIRPWRLQPLCKGANLNSLKSDPVQLYHKYKELWAQQKVPGEKSHSQLRWTIREKMLGQDPQPRPVSQASTEYRTRTMSLCK